MSFPLFAHLPARAGHLRVSPKTALALCLLATVHGAAAAPAPLTLGEAQQQAVARSRQLDAQDQAGRAAHEMATAAAQLPDPVLKAGIDNLPVSGSDHFSLGGDFMTMRRVGLSQELTRADKRQWRAARFEREADKAQAQKALTLAEIQRDSAGAWLELFYTSRMAEVLAGQAALSRGEIEAAEAAYRGGRGRQADLLTARAALLALDDRADEMARRQRVARTMLARWTGGEADVAGAPDIDSIRLDPATLDTELAHHPLIAVMNRQEEIAQADANLAQANRRGDWSVEVAFQQRGPAYSNMVSFGVSLPLQWDRKNRQDRELGARLAQVEQARAERDEMLRAHVAETRALVAEWRSGRERIERYTRLSLPLAGERSEAMLAAYRGGKATLTEVLAARRDEAEVRMRMLQLQLDTSRLWAQLNFLFPVDGMVSHAAMHSDQESQ